jgi:O-antigen/teichoic acid export membrane protein
MGPPPDEDESSARVVGQNVLSLLTAQVLTWTIGTVVLVVMPRHLGPAGMGEISLAIAIWMVAAPLIEFGSNRLVSREVARDPDAGSALLGRVLTMQATLFVVAAGCVALYSFVAGLEARARWLILIVGVSWIILAPASSLIAAVEGRERMRATSIVAVISRYVHGGMIIGLVALGAEIYAIAAVSIVSATVTLIGSIVIFRQDTRLWVKLVRPGLPQLLRQCLPYLLLIGSLILYQQVDVIVIAALVDEDAVGHYAAADRLFGNMLFLPVAIGAALFPRLTREVERDLDSAIALLRKGTMIMMLVALPLTAGVVVLGDRFAVLLFGADFAETGDVLQVYSVVLVPVSITILLGYFATASNRQVVWSFVLLTSAAATIPLDLLLVPWTRDTYDNPAIAGALAYVFTEAGALIFGLSFMVRGLIDRVTAVQLAKAALAAAVMGAFVYMLSDFALVWPVLAGALLYPALVLILRVIDFDEVATLGPPFDRISRFHDRVADVVSSKLDRSDSPGEGKGSNP